MHAPAIIIGPALSRYSAIYSIEDQWPSDQPADEVMRMERKITFVYDESTCGTFVEVIEDGEVVETIPPEEAHEFLAAWNERIGGLIDREV